MKTIIAATDLSANAHNAVNYAADMALSVNAELVLLHVFSTPLASTEMPVYVDVADTMAGINKELEQLRQILIRRTAEKVPIEIELRNGIFFNELNEVCKNRQPYAVVMGSQGTTAAERLLFGGHTIYAMKHLEWPVIAVPPEARFYSIKKIALATDFDDVAEYTPVEELEALMGDLHAELHIINTGKQRSFDPELIFQSAVLRNLLNSFHPYFHFASSENAEHGILEFVEENNIDLLIVLPKHRGLVEQLLKKSRTRQLVLHSHVPVMALHA